MTGKEKSTSGVPQGIAGIVCYFVPLIGGLVFLFLEKENRLIRFHAVQSVLLWIVFLIALAVLGWIPVIGWLVGLVLLVVWLYIMYQALMEREHLLPVIGRIAKKQVYGSEEKAVEEEEKEEK